ncbi:hypothetical protein VNO78_04411 [Psophocarpus tetragonolobus]|uniref:Uncharacterized protein n=1 Tax=Psophocarpus tetragonolobus TaxID=3891 RepID=A0AAN9XWM3_PSOTE
MLISEMACRGRRLSGEAEEVLWNSPEDIQIQSNYITFKPLFEKGRHRKETAQGNKKTGEGVILVLWNTNLMLLYLIPRRCLFVDSNSFNQVKLTSSRVEHGQSSHPRSGSLIFVFHITRSLKGNMQLSKLSRNAVLRKLERW